jgi:diguanylate cyclase (GGDEF)-like protein/PAS domain S-box-containing protein
MPTGPRHAWTAVFAGIAVGAGILLGFVGWLQPHRTLELSGLILAAMLTAIVVPRQSGPDDSGLMPASFVVDFIALLLLGPHAAMLVAAAGSLTTELAHPARAARTRGTLVTLATVMAATQAAGWAYATLGGTTGGVDWPWHGVPIAAAVVAWYLVKLLSSDVVMPLVTGQPVSRPSPSRVLRGVPSHVVGAAVAVALLEVFAHERWQILPAVAVPLYCAFLLYRDYVHRLGDDRRRRDVIQSLDEGMSLIDGAGRVAQWNDVLERIIGCRRERAVGRALTAVVPALAATELPRAIEAALADRAPRELTHLQLAAVAGERILHVKVLPVADGVTLLWYDVTERARADRAVARQHERLALAAEGANDGLWEWDLRSQEFYVSRRWRALLGQSTPAGIGRPEDWIDRVHVDDVGALKEALEAHLSGKTDHVQHEHRIRHEDGSYRRVLCRGVGVRGAGRRVARIAGSLTDTTEYAIARERIRTAGFLDPLTGLCNRAVFVTGLGLRLAESRQRRGGSRFAVLHLDLDRFKVVNENLGHLVGDELLMAVARRIESCLRPGDVLARLGGDEFAVLLNGLGDGQQANAIAFRIQDALSAPVSIGGRDVFTSASIGIAVGLAHYTGPDEIMRDADTAMYHAKARGKARHELFDEDMHARVRDRLGLENDLRHAVHINDFEVQYQPIVSLESRRCVGFESLVRWSRNGEAISPATFIPIAEELGLIEPLGMWVLQRACLSFADWQRRFPASGLDYITVNVSSRQLMQQNFLSIVEQAVHAAGLKPNDLRLEITETALMDSPNMAARLLTDLRDFGVKIYLDDFGTGYSSLSHLHKLPVDALKIDRSFVRSIELPDRPAIVESILALARTLNTSVVAEGIESELQAAELQRLGCTHAQGYLFSRPLSIQAVEELLIANQPLGRRPVQPADVGVATGSAPEPYYSSVPFEWPEHIVDERIAV